MKHWISRPWFGFLLFCCGLFLQPIQNVQAHQRTAFLQWNQFLRESLMGLKKKKVQPSLVQKLKLILWKRLNQSPGQSPLFPSISVIAEMQKKVTAKEIQVLERQGVRFQRVGGTFSVFQ